jgi:hypothetical protein
MISTTIATSRSGSAPSPTLPTTVAMPTIVIAKVTVRPSTMPSGRRRPPDPLAASIAGSTGSTQGDTAVPAPTTSAKISSSSIGVRDSYASVRPRRRKPWWEQGRMGPWCGVSRDPAGVTRPPGHPLPAASRP